MKKLFFLSMLFALTYQAQSQQLRLNSDEYFEMQGLNVMVFYDIYPEGHQGGVGIIQNGTRVATNGDLRLEPTPGQWQPIPKVGKRIPDYDQNAISVKCTFPDSSRHAKGFNPIFYPDLYFNYHVRVVAEGTKVRIIVDLDRELPEGWDQKVGFNLELFPALLFGKSWYLDKQTGIFPLQANGPMQKDMDGKWQAFPLASGKKLTIAPEKPEQQMIIESMGEDLQLLDGRFYHNNGWFVVRSLVTPGKTKNAIEWLVDCNVLPNFKTDPVIHASQVGYHPKQQKIAVLELDKNDTHLETIKLNRVSENGGYETVKTVVPSEWGKFLRFNYCQFDFSDVEQEGIYQVQYGALKSQPFQISQSIYKRHIWQPTLDYFLPVQMCHMRINEGYRVWHGLCHMDDALMAPVDTNHFDGYLQGASTLTDYEPLEAVSGLNHGGWHDAGDYDLRVESQAGTVWILSQAYELFNMEWDQTTVDQEKNLVEIHLPDGKNDFQQQVEHGLLTILGGYQSLGRLYRGIICNDLRQYVLLGDGSTMTDNMVYDSSLGEDEVKDRKSGVLDDRLVFTEENPGRELGVVKALAAAARVMDGYNDSLAVLSITAAEDLYRRVEIGDVEKLKGGKIIAAVELFITTGKEQYRKDIIKLTDKKTLKSSQTVAQLGRILTQLEDDKLVGNLKIAAKNYQEEVSKLQEENPFGVPYRPHIWGAGWNIQSFGVEQFYLQQAYPEIFGKEYLLNALNFVLGNHPGENTSSFVSGVGARSVTQAYGINRGDRSFIPGGSVSGTGIIRPDFPELKEWPYFWQQTEYVLGGGATNFLFLVLAADHLLE